MRSEGGGEQADPRFHWQGDRKVLLLFLPTPRCLHPKGENPEEAKVRDGQAAGNARRRIGHCSSDHDGQRGENRVTPGRIRAARSRKCLNERRWKNKLEGNGHC